MDSICNRYCKYDDFDDLYQVGMIGLINAKKKYKENKNTKFSTYAYYYILGEVTKYIRENRLIKISPEIIKLSKKIEKEKSVMIQKLGREPSILELSLYLGINEEKIKEVEESKKIIKSLDYSEEEISNLYDYVKVYDKNINENVLDLKNELKKLSKEEQSIIVDRYFEEMSQRETSENLGISQPQVSRKEEKILKKLKTRLI